MCVLIIGGTGLISTPMPQLLSYKRHRFPSEIISHCIWLYHRFGMSLRDEGTPMFGPFRM